MAQTRYITVAELAEAFDTRKLGQLSSDTGTPATVNESNAILLNCIERASGEVQSYAMRGGLYTASDLDDLNTNDDWMLKGLVSALAMGHLHTRRGMALPDDIQGAVTQARQTLEDLRDGQVVFPQDSGAIAAGKPSVNIISPGSRAKLSMVADEPFFPPRRTGAV